MEKLKLTSDKVWEPKAAFLLAHLSVGMIYFLHGLIGSFLGLSNRVSRCEWSVFNSLHYVEYIEAVTSGLVNVSASEEERDPYRIPTRDNIRMAMAWLVAGCRAGDSLVFHYSGHGSQQRNLNGDEVDGYDETLCPLDFQTRGMIVDDEINDTLVKPLLPGVKLHAIIDACHSGTMLDLPFLCRMNESGQYVWEDHRPRSGRWKGTSGGEAIAFSGCDDNQTSADTSALSKVTSTGAMTYCFIQAVERGQAGTYGSVLNAMRAAIRNTGGAPPGGGAVTSLLTMLLTGGSGLGLRQ
ncbi:Metacaspase-1, partial [Bienertia sinuspersici]